MSQKQFAAIIFAAIQLILIIAAIFFCSMINLVKIQLKNLFFCKEKKKIFSLIQNFFYYLLIPEFEFEKFVKKKWKFSGILLKVSPSDSNLCSLAVPQHRFRRLNASGAKSYYGSVLDTRAPSDLNQNVYHLARSAISER